MQRLRYLDAKSLHKFPNLRDSMFRDRAEFFFHRFRWKELTVDCHGREMDKYDLLNPFYVILEMSDGSHGASMRLMPMSGPTIIGEHFSKIQLPMDVYRPEILECTRFVVNKHVGSTGASALFVGAGEMFRRGKMSAILGLFDRSMLRVYQRLKNSPTLLSSNGDGFDWIGVGSWGMNECVWNRSLLNLGITGDVSSFWYDESGVTR